MVNWRTQLDRTVMEIAALVLAVGDSLRFKDPLRFASLIAQLRLMLLLKNPHCPPPTGKKWCDPLRDFEAATCRLVDEFVASTRHLSLKQRQAVLNWAIGLIPRELPRCVDEQRAIAQRAITRIERRSPMPQRNFAVLFIRRVARFDIVGYGSHI